MASPALRILLSICLLQVATVFGWDPPNADPASRDSRSWNQQSRDNPPQDSPSHEHNPWDSSPRGPFSHDHSPRGPSAGDHHSREHSSREHSWDHSSVEHSPRNQSCEDPSSLQFFNLSSWYSPNPVSCQSSTLFGCAFNISAMLVKGMYMAYDNGDLTLTIQSSLVYYEKEFLINTTALNVTALYFGSYQAIGDLQDFRKDSISFFSDVNFQQQVQVFSMQNQSQDTFDLTPYPIFKSLVILGRSLWLLSTDPLPGYGSVTERVCLFAPSDMPGFVQDIYGELGFKHNVTKLQRLNRNECPKGANGRYITSYTVNMVNFPIMETSVIDSNAPFEALVQP